MLLFLPDRSRWTKTAKITLICKCINKNLNVSMALVVMGIIFVVC